MIISHLENGLLNDLIQYFAVRCLESIATWFSAGIELTFFRGAGVVLCFGFKMKIMLITSGCFSCWRAVLRIQDFSASHTAVLVSRCTRSWEGTGPGQLNQTNQRNVPYQVASHWIINWKELVSECWCCSLGWACAGRHKEALCMACLIYSWFFLSISCQSVLVSTHEFFYCFLFLILSPSTLGLCDTELPARLDHSNHSGKRMLKPKQLSVNNFSIFS